MLPDGTLSCPAFTGLPMDEKSICESHGLSATAAYDTCKVAAKMKAAGFTCEAYSPIKGMTCKGTFPCSVYSEEVAVIIPPGYKPQDTTDMILHMHGHTPDDPKHSLDTVLTKYSFANKLAYTKRNSIMVVPYSKGKCETFNAHFKNDAGFNRFMDSVMGTISDAGLAKKGTAPRLALTGHSGASVPIGGILNHPCRSDPLTARTHCYSGGVKEVYLFDSIYEKHADFVNYAKSCPPNKFASAFVPQLGKDGQWKHNAAENIELWEKLYPKGSKGKSRSMLHPKAHEVELENAINRGPIFLQAEGAHDEIVERYFAKFLKKTGGK